MAYIDDLLQFPTATGTSTASATNGVNVTAQLGDLLRATNINQVRVVVLAAPAAGVTGLSVALMNGTNTVASGTLGTNTAAGNGTDLTVTAANSLIAGRQPLTAVFTGTATASASSIGTFNIEAQ